MNIARKLLTASIASAAVLVAGVATTTTDALAMRGGGGHGGWARGRRGYAWRLGSRRRLGPRGRLGSRRRLGPGRLVVRNAGWHRGRGAEAEARAAAGVAAAGATPVIRYGPMAMTTRLTGTATATRLMGTATATDTRITDIGGGVAGAALGAVTLGALGTAGYGPGWW